MHPENNNTATITIVVQDMMLLEIANPEILNKNFEYRILSSYEKLVRKGAFTGPTAQLRLACFLKENTVFICI